MRMHIVATYKKRWVVFETQCLGRRSGRAGSKICGVPGRQDLGRLRPEIGGLNGGLMICLFLIRAGFKALRCLPHPLDKVPK